MLSLAEYQTSFDELNKEEEEGMEVCLAENVEEVEEGPDEGELLVIRRALSGFATQDDKERPFSTLDAPWEAKYAHSSLMEGVIPMLHPKRWWTSSS